MQLRKKRPLLVLLVTLIPVVWMLMLIDNWSRDFTTNHARTTREADDPLLRPLESKLSPAAMLEKITAWVATKSRWQIVSSQQQADGGMVVHLVRTTMIFRFKDDIHVTIEPMEPAGCIVSATSQSRIGKGDLGQNPRNLKEMMGAIR
jgi:uncharacterized protein (DUF1499 family)